MIGVHDKIGFVLPAKGVEKTLARNIDIARTCGNPYVMVHESDEASRKIAHDMGVYYEVTSGGKGAALKTGFQCALGANEQYVFMLDTDLLDWTKEHIERMFSALIDNKIDCALSYQRREQGDGLVTEHIAIPLLRKYFPKIQVRQPLIGERAFTRECLKELMEQDLPDTWGIDVALTIETHQLGFSAEEIDLGFRKHASVESYSLAPLLFMGREVAEEIMRRVAKYSLPLSILSWIT